MKKLLKVMSVFSLCLVGTTPIQAQEEYISETDEITIEEMFKQAKAAAQYNLANLYEEDAVEVVATLTDENGELGDVEIYKYEPYSFHTNDEVSEAYILAATINTGLSQQSNMHDSNNVVYGFLKITYDQIEGNIYQYKLTKVSGNWSTEDTTIILRNRQLIYSCQGGMASGGYEWSQRNEYNLDANIFNYETKYSNYVLNDGQLGAVGAVSYIDARDQYGSKWTLETRMQLFNNNNLLSISGR